MMKSFDILYSLQVLTFVLYETDYSKSHDNETRRRKKISAFCANVDIKKSSVYLASPLNTREVKTCGSNIHRKKDTPHLTMNCTPNNVNEGQSVTICCCSHSRPSTIDLWLGVNSLVLSSKYYKNVLCHEIINVSRYDSGSYRCFAGNEVGIVNTQVKLNVLYPPHIPDQYLNFSDTDVSRTMNCLAQGVPANYTYGHWKHLSFFGEHIRYLNSAADGRVSLPQIENKINKYQDSGIYICTVSNGVVDRTDKRFQNGKIFVIANGPPLFVDKTKYKQYSQPGQKLYLEFIVYTKSMIKSYNVKSDNKEIPALMQMTSVNSTTIFHGTEITVEAFGVVLSFNISYNSNSHFYTVTLCNVYGNNSFEVEIELVTTEKTIIGVTKVASITIFVILVMCVPVSVAAVFLKKKRKINRERRIVDDIPELVEGQPVPVENIVYQDAIAFRPRPLQANEEVIEFNYETYSHEQNMRPLTGQLNYSDVYFQPSTSQDVRIRGMENRTVYSEVLNSERGSSVIETRSISSSDEEDFVDIEGLENFIDRSED